MSIEEAFSKSISLFNQAVDKHGNLLRMSSIIVSSKGKRFEHFFADESSGTDLRSVSKVALVLTVGIAISKGLALGDEALRLTTDVGGLLKQAPNLRGVEGIDTWEGVKLAHLLSNTIGHEEGFFFRKDIGSRAGDDLLPYIFSKPLDYTPGTHFSYSNVGPFLVSVLFQEFLGKSFSDVAGDLLLAKLGIRDFKWKNYGQYSAGCSGLELRAADLHKVAELVANDGLHSGERIVPKSWCDSMRTVFIETPGMCDPRRVFPKFGYGYGLWICDNGSYYCDGTDGQYLIVVADRGPVITTLGDQADMKPITQCMVPLLA